MMYRAIRTSLSSALRSEARAVAIPGGAATRQDFNRGASRVAQWLRALYCSASCTTRDPGFVPRLCRNWPRPGGPWGNAQLA